LLTSSWRRVDLPGALIANDKRRLTQDDREDEQAHGERPHFLSSGVARSLVGRALSARVLFSESLDIRRVRDEEKIWTKQK